MLLRPTLPDGAPWHVPDSKSPAADQADRSSEPSLRLSAVEAQVVPIGEVVAWVGLALWGGALLLMIGSDLVTWYRHHQEHVRDGHDGRGGHARRHPHPR